MKIIMNDATEKLLDIVVNTDTDDVNSPEELYDTFTNDDIDWEVVYTILKQVNLVKTSLLKGQQPIN